MSIDSERCPEHPFEPSVRLCGQCGRVFCQDCVVQPFPKRPPMCKGCAMAAAGIRTAAARTPTRSKKEIKAILKAQAAAEAASRQVATQPLVIDHGMSYAEPGVVPAPPAGMRMPARTKRLWRPAS